MAKRGIQGLSSFFQPALDEKFPPVLVVAGRCFTARFHPLPDLFGLDPLVMFPDRFFFSPLNALLLTGFFSELLIALQVLFKGFLLRPAFFVLGAEGKKGKDQAAEQEYVPGEHPLFFIFDNVYPEAPQKIDAFVARQALKAGIAVLVKHLFDAGGEDHPGTGDTGREGHIKGGSLHAYIVAGRVQDGILFCMKGQ